MSNYYYIQVVRGRVQWRYIICARNGHTISVSQRYYSKSNAIRAAHKLGEALNLTVEGY